MKKIIVRLLTKHLFKWVSEEDLFEAIPGKGITHKGKLLSPEREEALVNRADSFRRSYLWKVLSDEIKYTAYLHWMKQGEDVSTRMLLRSEEIIRNKLNDLANLKVDKKVK